MNENELFSAIEKLNQEKKDVINHFQMQNSIQSFFYLLKNRKIKKTLLLMREKIILKFVKNKTDSITRVPDIFFNNSADYKKKKIAVYTCIVGDYDVPQEPLVKTENVDFFLFTDSLDKYKDLSSSFSIKEIPLNLQEKGCVLANRYIKFHPKVFFQNYDYAIYIDGNVRIISDIRPLVNCCTSATGLAMHWHRFRQCVYEEARLCVLLRKGKKKLIKDQMKKYRKEGLPEKYGLNEANMIVSDLNNEISCRLLDLWWNEFVRSGSMRDQLAWPYILWKNGFSIKDVGFLGKDICQNSKLEVMNHVI